MEAAYFKAAIPEPFRILGLTLKPLSLGRYILLRRFGCAFVADESASAGVPDLLLGLVICSMRVDEFLDGMEMDSLSGDVQRWGSKICPHAWVGLLPVVGKHWRARYAFDVVQKMGLFKRYIDEGSVLPKYWEGEGESRASGAHWSQCVEVILRGELGWTREEINEAPLTKALSDYFKFAENQGLVQLMTAGEVAMVEAAEKEEGTANIQHPTSNNQHPMGEGRRGGEDGKSPMADSQGARGDGQSSIANSQVAETGVGCGA